MFHFHSSPRWHVFSLPSHVLFCSQTSQISSPFMPLFLTPEGVPMIASRFLKFVRQTFVQCNLPPCQFSGHSFRIGAATSAATQGVSTASLQQLSRRSTSAFSSYVRPNFYSVLCSVIYQLLGKNFCINGDGWLFQFKLILASCSCLSGMTKSFSLPASSGLPSSHPLACQLSVIFSLRLSGSPTSASARPSQVYHVLSTPHQAHSGLSNLFHSVFLLHSLGSA
ncbi:hypothetical protein AMECASPLE_038418 [Ameca splendens]|uniref:Uncharacterized protein n=1 Tax=Ameca splendens TaxID=208324 RepID=A0ABV0YWJ1_9TELE